MPSFNPPAQFPALNWLELEKLSQQISDELSGEKLFIDRIFIPARMQFRGGYLKGEWALKLHSRKRDWVFSFSVRSGKPSVTLKPGNSSKAAGYATHSAFDLALTKHLRGGHFLGVEALPKERIAAVWISAPAGEERFERYGVIISLIPAAPEAFLVGLEKGEEKGWPILARSRVEKIQEGERYVAPDGNRAPENPTVREELVSSAESYTHAVEESLHHEAFDQRVKEAQKSLKDQLKQTRKRVEQSLGYLSKSKSEPDWKHLGDLILAQMGSLPELKKKSAKESQKITHYRELLDYTSDSTIKIPWDPKLTPQAQAQKFYQSGKRKQRKLEEAQGRLGTFEENLKKLEALAESPPEYPDWKALESFERAVGIEPPDSKPPQVGRGKAKQRKTTWLGRVFHSKDGTPIWIGKARDENLELTFKHAKGNDLWMHVRGKPGAHAVIPLHSGKTASLETLLDAAHLVVFYSGGENWSTTEVDYTFRKHVKRIKNSTEVSYTHNKTLMIKADQERLKRLLDKK